MIRVYDGTGNLIETHEQADDFKDAVSDCPSFPTRFFWRERGDNLFEARIAAERIE
jgi:hypothetical protein